MAASLSLQSPAWSQDANSHRSSTRKDSKPGHVTCSRLSTAFLGRFRDEIFEHYFALSGADIMSADPRVRINKPNNKITSISSQTSQNKNKKWTARARITSPCQWENIWRIFLVSHQFGAEAEHVLRTIGFTKYLSFEVCHVPCLLGLKQVRARYPAFRVTIRSKTHVSERAWKVLLEAIYEVLPATPSVTSIYSGSDYFYHFKLLKTDAEKAGQRTHLFQSKLGHGSPTSLIFLPVFGKLEVRMEFSEHREYITGLTVCGDLGKFDALWIGLEKWKSEENESEHRFHFSPPRNAHIDRDSPVTALCEVIGDRDHEIEQEESKHDVSASREPTSFYSLPREIREQIYDNHFKNVVHDLCEENRIADHTRDDGTKKSSISIRTHTQWQRFWEVFQTSKLVHTEAEQHLWKYSMPKLMFVACHFQCFRGLKQVRERHPDFQAHIYVKWDQLSYDDLTLVLRTIVREFGLDYARLSLSEENGFWYNRYELADMLLEVRKLKCDEDSPRLNGGMYTNERFVIDFPGTLIFEAVFGDKNELFLELLLEGNLGRLDALWIELEQWKADHSWKELHLATGFHYQQDLKALTEHGWQGDLYEPYDELDALKMSQDPQIFGEGYWQWAVLKPDWALVGYIEEDIGEFDLQALAGAVRQEEAYIDYRYHRVDAPEIDDTWNDAEELKDGWNIEDHTYEINGMWNWEWTIELEFLDKVCPIIPDYDDSWPAHISPWDSWDRPEPPRRIEVIPWGDEDEDA